MLDTQFKIIELPARQVLLTKDFDADEEDAALLRVTFFTDNVKIDYALGFKDERTRNGVFDLFSEVQAQELVDGVTGLTGVLDV